MENGPDIKRFFEPRSVAVIGASSVVGKVGYKLMDNIISGNYKGGLYPINPRGGKIFGIPAHRQITDIAGPVDMAVIAIPASFVLEEVRRCGEKGVSFLTIVTSGFSEIGDSELERKIVDTARSYGMRILGPNIFGIYSSKVDLNATFGPKGVKKGKVAIITQSGALGIAMIGKTATEGIGLSMIVSLGNKSDLDESDFLDYLARDKSTKVIMIYIEGITKGEKLLGSLKKISREKPVVVIKSGRSRRGALAAASHTGSLAGSDEVFDSVMKQSGVFRAESLDEGFNWIKFLADTPLPKGNSNVIVTNGGGIGVLATDACEKYNIEMLDEPAHLKKTFQSKIPSFGSTKNPIDITGQGSAEVYKDSLIAALESERINSVMALYCQTADFNKEQYKEMIMIIHNEYMSRGKPIAFSLVGGREVEECVNELKENGLPAFKGVYEMVSCFGVLHRFRESKARVIREIAETKIDMDTVNITIDNALSEGRNFLLAHEAKKVLDASEIPTPKSFIAKSIEEAVNGAENIGYPLVMKIVSRDILHKSDAGGVAVNLDNREEVMDAYQLIIRNAKNYDQHAKIDGIEVAEMIPQGLETIIGARRDRSFGPILMFGLGGIYVEVMKDVSFRALPVSRDEIYSLLKDIRSYPLLLGVRGEESKDIEKLIDVMIKVGTLLRKVKRITDIEINPLFVFERGKGVKVVDIRIMIAMDREVLK
ncbi:MAG: acetate--CoA ligase family protein [Candidatus Thermoplasmatota archaeon]|nr:acetate--CoA ligase family protein [Candidatus Thermoplasmatota archaeon]